MSDLKDSLRANGDSSSELAQALALLNNALDSLDNTVTTSLEAGSKARSADEEVQRMADDRAKLARELDETESRAKRLAETNKEVSRRLVDAMETVRGVLDRAV